LPTVHLDTLVNRTTVGTDVAGPMADFDPTKPYAWPAVQWTGNYSGPADAAALSAATAFDTSGFANPIAGTFGWQLDAADRILSLAYTPSAVPEPGTLALTAAALGLGWTVRRRGPAGTGRRHGDAIPGPGAAGRPRPSARQVATILTVRPTPGDSPVQPPLH
jgi:hypothetical protein